jgi:hypothetical protein
MRRELKTGETRLTIMRCRSIVGTYVLWTTDDRKQWMFMPCGISYTCSCYRPGTIFLIPSSAKVLSESDPYFLSSSLYQDTIWYDCVMLHVLSHISQVYNELSWSPIGNVMSNQRGTPIYPYSEKGHCQIHCKHTILSLIPRQSMVVTSPESAWLHMPFSLTSCDEGRNGWGSVRPARASPLMQP